MGISRLFIQGLVREHAYKPLHGTAILIGRQTVYVPLAEILRLFKEQGLSTEEVEATSIEFDTSTVDRLSGHESRSLISDVSLMKLFGISRVMALDHSSYEGADIVHDLRQPIPSELCGAADILIDGSTLDNVFAPSVVLQNYSRLLKPGGRLFLINAFSSFESAYVIMPPLWYVDYFVMNGFMDCRVYVTVRSERRANIFYVDLKEIDRRGREMGRFGSPYHMYTIVFAEKGGGSTADRLPIQQDYRSPEEWATYRANLSVMLGSRRPHLVRSNCELFLVDFQGGHRFIDKSFNAVE